MIHFHTEIETYEEYNHILNVAVWRSKIKFTAIERSKILQLLKSKDKDTDTSISDYMDKRIKEFHRFANHQILFYNSLFLNNSDVPLH